MSEDIVYHVYKKYVDEALWTYDSTHTSLLKAQKHAAACGWAYTHIDSGCAREEPAPRAIFMGEDFDSMEDAQASPLPNHLDMRDVYESRGYRDVEAEVVTVEGKPTGESYEG